MKNIFIAFLFLLSTNMTASTYFVANNGSDSAPGTEFAPWATWQKAFTSAVAGDTVYFRGGIYYTMDVVECNQSGTESNRIYFLKYPGETPILDGINKASKSHGLYISNQKYIYISGLTFRNNRQIVDDDDPSGIVLSECNHITIESCTTYNNGKRGFYISEPDTITINNCDSYDNADSMQSLNIGGGGDGFLVDDDGSVDDTLSLVKFLNCRSWHNSDDGFDIGSEGVVDIIGCWSWENGYLDGGSGIGFNLGVKDIWVSSVTTRRLTNCIAAYNTSIGFCTNDNNMLSNRMDIYNNTSYKNGEYGFVIYSTAGSNDQELERVFINNLSYDNGNSEVLVSDNAQYTYEANNWNIPVTVTNGDFISLNPSMLSGPRQLNGSLPVLDFLNLLSTSDLVDAGTSTGLLYNGFAPDLGAFECNSTPGSNLYPSIVITSPLSGSVFEIPASITISITVSDPDGTISKVDFIINNIKVGETTSSPWSLQLNDLTKGTYSITAVAIDNLGARAISSEVLITVALSSYVEKETNIPYINIYPNPSNGLISIDCNELFKDNTTLVLYDNNGKTIFNRQLGNENIINVDLSQSPKGLYFLRIVNGGKFYFQKVVIY